MLKAGYEPTIGYRDQAPAKHTPQTLSPAENAVFVLLDRMIDAVEEAGVDVSFFPHAARMVLIEYAKKITKEVLTDND